MLPADFSPRRIDMSSVIEKDERVRLGAHVMMYKNVIDVITHHGLRSEPGRRSNQSSQLSVRSRVPSEPPGIEQT